MNMRQGVFPAFVIVLFFSSCKKADMPVDQPKTTPAAEVQKPDLAYNVKAGTLLDMVNQVRASGCNCGSDYMPPVTALTWNDTLALAAYQHSEDMKTNNDFSHTGSDGSDVRGRITSKGYIWSICGENIAWGQTSEQLVMNSWLKSERHCKNIMNKNFKEMGAGRADDYWTQVFGAKR
ncbi:MAG: CAP domain-containing protein [Sphingobacteriales bacterium]|nr:CAP domain-containing protein [Sphingobacteriales bacterium]OJY84278.1 MAG: hypothetical protein BGP14_18670 [Sphingobacteriales bacterium 44-15]